MNCAIEDWREYCGTKILREPDVYVICDLEITCYSENKEKWNKNIFTYKELPNKPVGSYISVTRESFLMGPGGGVRLESVLKGNELLSVIIKEGQKHNGK